MDINKLNDRLTNITDEAQVLYDRCNKDDVVALSAICGILANVTAIKKDILDELLNKVDSLLNETES